MLARMIWAWINVPGSAASPHTAGVAQSLYNGAMLVDDDIVDLLFRQRLRDALADTAISHQHHLPGEARLID
jgi:hypothetical protein